MSFCDICMRETDEGEHYHPACLRKLFGTPKEPEIELSLSEIVSKAQKMAGKISISGFQPKLSMVRKGGRIVPVYSGGQFVLKPQTQTQTFQHLPENEHLFMSLASDLGITVPLNGLLDLKDGSKAYLVRRFDRTSAGDRLRCEDFTQIIGQDKYTGSVEKVGRRIMELSEFPGLDAQLFFERVLLFFLIGNGDAHLKNYSMLETADGLLRLSPAYDIVCSKLVFFEEEDSALTINGKRNRLARGDFRALAEYLGISRKVYDQILAGFEENRTLTEERIAISHLPDNARDRLHTIVSGRYDRLFG